MASAEPKGWRAAYGTTRRSRSERMILRAQIPTRRGALGIESNGPFAVGAITNT
jgi:hypothetical protein